MTNKRALECIRTYSTLYETRWGKAVDFVGMPKTVSQEKLVQILRYICDTGDSLTVGAQKVRETEKAFLERLLQESGKWDAAKSLLDPVFEKKCPLCGNTVRCREYGHSFVYACDTEFCCKFVFRGI